MRPRRTATRFVLGFPRGAALAEANAGGSGVLNAFAFTCGAGVASLAGGANSVTNLDFSQSALDVGIANARANALPASAFDCVCSDAWRCASTPGCPATTDRARSRRWWSRRRPWPGARGHCGTRHRTRG